MKFKLKYQGGATKKICMAMAAAERKKFSKLLWSGDLQINPLNSLASFDLISFSGKRDFEEQVLSICSFLVHVGRPATWTIYSDGSYTDKEKECLLKKFSFVQFKEWNHNKKLENNILLKKYMEVCHLSKKLHAVLGHTYERQTMYLDSDVVFYHNASAYFNSDLLKEGFWYIPETNWGSLKDKGIYECKDMFILNSGLLILNKTFNFEDVYEYLNSLNFNFGYFTEQSSFNYSFKKQRAGVLDPRQFVIDTEDQFDFSMAMRADEMSVRHYVNPVRHKMWQKGWKWHLR